MAQDDRSVGQGHAGDSEDNGGEERDNTQRSITSPAATKPRGAARVLIEITAVITIARSSSGVRAVRTAMSGPLMSGVQNTWCAWKRPRAFPARRDLHDFDSKEDLLLELAARDNERLVQFWGEGLGGDATGGRPRGPDWIGVYMEMGRKIRTDPDFKR